MATPKAWSWDSYEEWLVEKWSELLEANPSETKVHRFLESHPCLLPGGEGGSESIGGHHGPFPAAAITRPPLPGLSQPIPDFMWISKISGEVHPVLIELEEPGKKWFRTKDKRPVQHHQLTEAIDQVGEWKNWFSEDENRLQFFRLYGVSEVVRRSHVVNPKFVLIYGRRSEFQNDVKKSKALANVRARSGLELMTYDRLVPLRSSRRWITAKVTGKRLVAVAVPPTFEISPAMLDWVQGIDGLEAAIERNALISEGRRAFLLRRIPQLRKLVDQDRKESKPRRVGQWE